MPFLPAGWLGLVSRFVMRVGEEKGARVRVRGLGAGGGQKSEPKTPNGIPPMARGLLPDGETTRVNGNTALCIRK